MMGPATHSIKNQNYSQSRFGSTSRDFRVDVLRGAALLMIFVDHSSGNVFSYLTLQHLQFSDASEVFFLLSGYSCMAAYGRRLDSGDIKGTWAAIARRCLTLYLAQMLTLVSAEAIVWAWGFTEPLQLGALHGLSSVYEGNLGISISSLFRTNTWSEILNMALLVGEPSYFDILRPYIVLIAVFPVMWWGLRRAPARSFAIAAVIWIASHGPGSLHFNDLVQGAPWTFNPFGWQFIFFCGAALRVAVERRFNLPRSPVLIGLSLCIVATGLVFSLCYAVGLQPPRPMLWRNNLSPIRLLNALALVYLAMSRDWHPWFRNLPLANTLRIWGRHSLLIFSIGLLMSLNVDLIFIKFGQGLPTQIFATFGGAALLMAVAQMAEQRRRSRRSTLVAS